METNATDSLANELARAMPATTFTRLDQHCLLFERASVPEVIGACKSLTTPYHHRHSETDEVTRIHHIPATHYPEGERGFSSQGLPLHTDSLDIVPLPEVLAFGLTSAPTHGGEMTIANAWACVEALQENDPPTYALLTTCEAVCHGTRFKVIDDSSHPPTVRVRFDGAIDGPPHLMDALDVFMQSLRPFTRTLPARAGAGYVISNGIWLHGRAGFVGTREGYRYLGYLRK